MYFAEWVISLLCKDGRIRCVEVKVDWVVIGFLLECFNVAKF